MHEEEAKELQVLTQLLITLAVYTHELQPHSRMLNKLL